MIPGVSARYAFDRSGIVASSSMLGFGPGLPCTVRTAEPGWLARIEPAQTTADQKYGCHRAFLKMQTLGDWHVAQPGLYELHLGLLGKGPQSYTRILFYLTDAGVELLAVGQSRTLRREIMGALASYTIFNPLPAVVTGPPTSPEREAVLARENERLLAEADELLAELEAKPR